MKRRASLGFVLGLALVGCQKAPVAPVTPRPAVDVERVAVVVNDQSPESQALAAYYMSRRSIPASQLIKISVDPVEEIPKATYLKQIEVPVMAAVKKLPPTVDFILLTKGIPIRIKEKGYSVDGHLAAYGLDIKPIEGLVSEQIIRAGNPYYKAKERFSAAKYRFHLVSRLDGYTLADAKAMVDHAVDARRVPGPFFFDMAGNRTDGGYRDLNEAMTVANDGLNAKQLLTSLDQSNAFFAPEQALMGYCSWGSNDGRYKRETYRKLKFIPGSIAETFVSTSARTFKPTDKGQSLIADLIQQGVTGVKGYVSEPYTFSLARPEILFDRYTDGYTLVESFFMASPVLKWKDIVLGDPLCQPYRR